MQKLLPCAGASTRLSSRPVVSRRHAAFKGVRPSVRVFAAEDEAARQNAPRAPRVEKTYALRIEDIKEGQEITGTVVTVESFGAFVDIGCKQSGMIHVSKLSSGFVKNAMEVVQPGQQVTVSVIQVDAVKGRIGLALQGAEGGAAPAERSYDGGDAADDSFNEDALEGVDLEAGQVAVQADVRGYEDLTFILEESNAAELTDMGLTDMEADLDAVELVFDCDAPPYLEEVQASIAWISDAGVSVSFMWQGKALTGFIAREELKVPFAALPAEQQAAISAEWKGSGVAPPLLAAYDEEYDINDFYKVSDLVYAFVLDPDFSGDGIQLTHFTDEEVTAEAIEAFEMDSDEDEELLELLRPEAGEVLAQDPEDLADEEDVSNDPEMAGLAATERSPEGGAVGLDFGAGAGMIRSKDGSWVNPMGLPSRTASITPASLVPLATTEIDFEGDEVELDDYWTVDYTIPNGAMSKVGLKLTFNEAGEAVVTEREDFKGDLPVFSLHGDVASRAAAFVEDLLTADDPVEYLPVRARRQPIILAAAVSSISAATVKELRDKTGAGMMDCKKALGECAGDMEKSQEWLRKKGLAGADKKAGRIAAEGGIARYIHPGSRLGVLLEVNCETDFVASSDKFNSLINELGMIIASTDCSVVSPEDVSADMLAKERETEMAKEDLAAKPEAMRAKIVEGRLDKIKNQMALMNQASLSDPNKTVSELVKETIAAIGENVKIRRFVKYNLGEGMQKRANDFAAEVAQQTQAKAAAPAAPKVEEPKKEEAPKKPLVAVAAAVVKELRDMTGAGMMDCKKALGENEGNMEKAQEWLRQKGLAGADKKAGRIAAEGVIAAYIHPGSRLGVLLEVNCETDFVAASDPFNQLVTYIAMGIAAAQGVAYVSAEDIPAEVYEREKQLEMAREDIKSKPEAIRAKIAEGRARKIGEEMALLNQPFLTDNSKTIAEAIKEATAAIGEKISVRRFVKFSLGEGLEKKSNDFAAEVAAATAVKK